MHGFDAWEEQIVFSNEFAERSVFDKGDQVLEQSVILIGIGDPTPGDQHAAPSHD